MQMLPLTQMGLTGGDAKPAPAPAAESGFVESLQSAQDAGSGQAVLSEAQGGAVREAERTEPNAPRQELDSNRSQNDEIALMWAAGALALPSAAAPLPAAAPEASAQAEPVPSVQASSSVSASQTGVPASEAASEGAEFQALENEGSQDAAQAPSAVSSEDGLQPLAEQPQTHQSPAQQPRPQKAEGLKTSLPKAEEAAPSGSPRQAEAAPSAPAPQPQASQPQAPQAARVSEQSPALQAAAAAASAVSTAVKDAAEGGSDQQPLSTDAQVQVQAPAAPRMISLLPAAGTTLAKRMLDRLSEALAAGSNDDEAQDQDGEPDPAPDPSQIAVPSARVQGPVKAKAQADLPPAVSAASEALRDLIETRRPGQVTVTLRPDDLGTLTVKVDRRGQEVHASITASNEGVRQSLAAHQNELAQSLEARGHSLASLHIAQEPAPASDSQKPAAALFQSSPAGREDQLFDQRQQSRQPLFTREDFERIARLSRAMPAAQTGVNVLA